MSDNDSILTSTKKALGLSDDYDVFDSDIIMHINTTFFVLQQLGVGPSAGFSITDKSSKWDAFLLNHKNLEAAKSYLYIKVRLLFDPPSTSFAITAMEKVASEYEWRLNVEVENEKALAK